MRSLPRHGSSMPTADACSSTGSCAGASTTRGRAQPSRQRDPQAPRRVHRTRGSGSRRPGTRGRSTPPADERGASSSARSARAESRFRFRTTRPSSTTGSRRSGPTRRRRRASTGRPDRRSGGARSFSTPTGTRRRSASSRPPSSPASSQSGSTADASSGRSCACLRLRLREPRRRGRRHDRASARADLRARPRPADHGGKGRGTPPSPRSAKRQLPLVRRDAGRRRAPTASSRRTRASSSAVPFAARWPFEVAVRARRHGLGRLADLVPAEQRDLALALRDVARRYDALFDFPLPYMMVAQEAPARRARLASRVRAVPGASRARSDEDPGQRGDGARTLPQRRRAGGRGAPARRASTFAAEPIELDTLFTVTPAGRGDALVSA